VPAPADRHGSESIAELQAPVMTIENRHALFVQLMWTRQNIIKGTGR
jgi:hypothetical protein